MPSARSVLAKAPAVEETPKRGWSKKQKAVWAKKAERQKAIVAAALADNKGHLSNNQTVALGRALHVSKERIREMVEEARETLVTASLDYVNMHRQAVKDALANGDAKSLEVAVKGSQWAMTNISHDGARIIDKPTNEPGGTKILLGIQLGGMIKPDGPVIDAKVLPAGGGESSSS